MDSERRLNSSKSTRLLMLLATALLVSAGIFGGGLILSSSASSSSETSSASQLYNNVQIFVNTQSSDVNQFFISAYNSTGGLVATSQSQYPALSFELPSGTYLFTVMATEPYNYYATGSPPILYSNQPSTGIAIPTPSSPPSEYGYSMVKISSSTALTLSTTEITQLPTSKLTIHVSFSNGTAASGASVGASIVGGWYWIYENKVVLWNQTNSIGVTTLTTPAVPIEVTAWDWVKVVLPTSQVTTQVTVAGEKVNVTAYWEPTYIGLAGEALILPPETSAAITLYHQQPSYWILPQGVATAQGTESGLAPSSTGIVTSSPGGVPANQYSVVQGSSGSGPTGGQSAPSGISPLPQQLNGSTAIIATTSAPTESASTTSESSSGGTSMTHTSIPSSISGNVPYYDVAVVVALILAAAGLVIVFRRR